MNPGERTVKLIVFSDDWGRHPSSCQHLLRHLLPRYPALWVNTIGTRRPGLSWGDLGKAAVKLREWVAPRAGGGHAEALPAGLRIISPRMWPGFRRAWQRRLNARWISGAVNQMLGARQGDYRVVVTTLPITADLMGAIDADRWVYYCVDDFAVWPGLDGSVMRLMEELLVRRAAAVLAVSETLRERLSATGTPVTLLTHGVDLDHWRQAKGALPAWWTALRKPIILFWGLVDARLDAEWCRALVQAEVGTLVLAGPRQSPPPQVLALAGQGARLVMPGPVPYEDLPTLAQAADVLVMPYADLPVTRAMQPLKLKEYLAAGFPEAGKPVVVRDLPATRSWSDAADVVDCAGAFVAAVRRGATQGMTGAQRAARARLVEESWEHKARLFEAVLLGGGAGGA